MRGEICLVSRWNSYASSQCNDLLMFLSISPVNWGVKLPASVLYSHRTASEILSVRRKRAAAFQRNKRCFIEQRKPFFCLHCTVHLQQVATVWGAFLSMISIYRPRRCSAGCERCRSTECQSLAGLSH